eukprot:3086286-Amphidinium_carterae.1
MNRQANNQTHSPSFCLAYHAPPTVTISATHHIHKPFEIRCFFGFVLRELFLLSFLVGLMLVAPKSNGGMPGGTKGGMTCEEARGLPPKVCKSILRSQVVAEISP